MNTRRFLLALTAIVTLLAGRAGSADDKELARLKTETEEAIKVFKQSDSTLKKHFDEAAGYAVFPSVGKGGLIIGGAHGTGLVFEKGKLVGRTAMTQVTVGAQIGGQGFRQVIFFEDQDALKRFKQGNYEMNAQVGAVAAAEGAAKNARYREGVMVFTKAIRGLMAEASVGGQKFKYEALP